MSPVLYLELGRFRLSLIKITMKLTFDWLSKQFSMKTFCFITLVLSFCYAYGNTSTNYKEVEKFGSSCPKRDSCDYQRTIYRRQHASIKESNCNCDYSCPEYGDCCIDAQWKTSGKRNNLNCLSVEGIGGVYMKDSCPPSYKGPGEVRRRCESTKLGDQVDPLGALPVTDPQTGLTYKNYYCNICNGESDTFVIWSQKVECPLLSLRNTSNTITNEYVLENLASDGHSWGLYFNDEIDDSLFFHDCNVYPVLPLQLEGKVRLCKPDLISNCPSSWDDEEIRAMCKSYTGARFDQDGKSYRNVHCAICNGINATQLNCQPVVHLDIFRELGIRNFALLLDFGQGDGEEVGKIGGCKRGEVFDPFYKKCRSLLCFPGYVRKGRTCVLINEKTFSRFFARPNRRIVRTSTTPKYKESNRNITLKPEELLPTPAATNVTLSTTLKL